MCTFVLPQISIRLENNDFIINSYELCVENKLVKGEAVTLVWYVDDPKVSHKDPFEVKKISILFEDIQEQTQGTYRKYT